MRYLFCAVILFTATSIQGQGIQGQGIQGQGGAFVEPELLLGQPPSPPSLSDTIIDPNFIHSPGAAIGPGAPTLGLDGQPVPNDVQATLDVWEATMGAGMEEFRGYRHDTSSTEWITGDGNQFGMFSFNFGTTHHRRGVANGLATGFQWHLLSGPDFADLPPRVYDFSLGYQVRDWIGRFGYDLSGSVTASSDFEGSVRDGIRYPSHAVGYIRMAHWADLVMGVDYINREDVGILPVGGVILRPNNSLQMELVFPRPRIDISLSPTKRFYLSGELGGGQWAIERELMLVDDLLTYSDLRLAIGIETSDGPQVSGAEIAWLFNRKVEFSSDVGNSDLDDTIMLRFVHSQ